MQGKMVIGIKLNKNGNGGCSAIGTLRERERYRRGQNFACKFKHGITAKVGRKQEGGVVN